MPDMPVEYLQKLDKFISRRVFLWTISNFFVALIATVGFGQIQIESNLWWYIGSNLLFLVIFVILIYGYYQNSLVAMQFALGLLILRTSNNFYVGFSVEKPLKECAHQIISSFASALGYLFHCVVILKGVNSYQNLKIFALSAYFTLGMFFKFIYSGLVTIELTWVYVCYFLVAITVISAFFSYHLQIDNYIHENMAELY